MLQHASRTWRWGRLVLVHPAGNTDFPGRAPVTERYSSTTMFASVTVEELLEAGVLPAQTTIALRSRYLPC